MNGFSSSTREPHTAARTRLGGEDEGVGGAALGAAGAQHHARGEEHLVLLVAHQRNVEDGETHFVGAQHHVIRVLHVDRDAGVGVVGLGADLDLPAADVHSRAEGDGDVGLQRDIPLVERGDALLGNDVGTHV